MIDLSVLREKISNMFQLFHVEGEVAIYQKDRRLVEVQSQQESAYFPIHKHANVFVHLLLIKGLEIHQIDFNTLLVDFIPELKYADQITFLHVLKDNTGLPDLHGYLANQYQIEEQYQSFTKQEQIAFDLNFRNSVISQEKIFELYHCLELDHKPGTYYDYSKIGQTLGVVLIERLFQLPYDEVLETYLFQPLEIQPSYFLEPFFFHQNCYYNQKQSILMQHFNLFIGLTTQHVFQIYSALTKGKIVSLVHLKEMKRLTPFQGISFTEAQSQVHHFLAGPFSVFDFKKMDIQVIKVASFSGYEQIMNGEAYSFDNYFMPQLEPLFLEYHNPKLVKLNKKNVYDLLHIENDPNQLWFMGQTKYMLAYQYVEPNATCYLLIDHGIVVGTVCLYIDRKGQKFDIANVLIDKKYQGKGYGKALIRESLKIFSKEKIKTLTMFVEKDNERAFQTYLKCGFKIKNSFPRSYELEYSFA